MEVGPGKFRDEAELPVAQRRDWATPGRCQGYDKERSLSKELFKTNTLTEHVFHFKSCISNESQGAVATPGVCQP